MEINQDAGIELNGFLESLLEILSGGAVGMNLAGDQILFTSTGIRKMLGYDLQETDADWRCGTDWENLLYPADAERARMLTAAYVREQGRAEVSLRLLKKDGTPLWVKGYAGLAQSERWGEYLLCLLLDDSAAQAAIEAEKRALDRVDQLARTVPGGVAQLTVDEWFTIRFASDGYYEMTGYTCEEVQQPPFNGGAAPFVNPEDLPRVLAAVDRLKRGNGPVSVDYRIRKKDASAAWNTAYCIGLEDEGDKQVLNAVILDTTAAKENERRLVELINSIPGGVARLRVTADDLQIEYASEGFYRLCGYSEQEFGAELLNNCYLLLVYPEDREMLLEKARELQNVGAMCPACDYRIRDKAGEVRWMRASMCGSTGAAGNATVVQCVIDDVTEMKFNEKRAILGEERYRIIAEQAEEVVYDWDMESDLVYHSPVFEKKFGYDMPVCRLQDFMQAEIVHEEDKPVITKMLTCLNGGERYQEIEYRIRRADGSYIWCRNRGTVLLDEQGKATQVVGILTDIDAEYRERQALLERAMCDPLTGLLNRTAFQERLQDLLTGEGANKRHAFFLVDIDHFKDVNDQLGHGVGDQILQAVAARLLAYFREQDLVGRLGGDEFTIFLSGAPDRRHLEERARSLVWALAQPYECEDGVHSISGSVGVSCFPTSGRSFHELYQRADEALYRAKGDGRNRFHLCEEPDKD